jgi:hypothetical protein
MTEKTTLEVLLEARALIAKPENWTQQAVARDRFGNGTSVLAENAISFCALGALCRAHGNEMWAGRAFTPLSEEMRPNIPTFNNSRTHADVLAAFERAIAAERAVLGIPTSEQDQRVSSTVKTIISDALSAASRAPEAVA